MTISQYRQTKIPQSRRDQVQERDKMRCCRCGVPAPQGQWHHRRSRSVVELHRHCSCNGVWLCRTCHMDVHKNPERSMDEGFIVRRSVLEPATVPLHTTWGTRSLDCKGNYTYLPDDVPTVGTPRGATNA